MQFDAPRAQLHLADDELMRLRGACGSRLEATSGHVWVTLDGEFKDIVLSAGDSLLIDSRGVVTVSAIRGAASLRVHARSGARPGGPAAGACRPARPDRLRRWLAGVSLSSVALA